MRIPNYFPRMLPEIPRARLWVGSGDLGGEMRTRAKAFIDIKTYEESFSFQVYWKDKWIYLGNDNRLLEWKTEQERDVAQAAVRKTRRFELLKDLPELRGAG